MGRDDKLSQPSKVAKGSVILGNIDENVVQTEEVGGPSGLEPTRYGDWERRGRCIDF